MALGELLAVSETVVRKGNENSPYQPTDERVLPQFGTTANRRGAVRTEADPPEVARKPPVQGVDYGFEDRVDGWSTLPNRNRRRSNVRHVSCLGSVSIMRNDLADSDFVLIPQRSAGASGSSAFQQFLNRVKSLITGSKSGQ